VGTPRPGRPLTGGCGAKRWRDKARGERPSLGVAAQGLRRPPSFATRNKVPFKRDPPCLPPPPPIPQGLLDAQLKTLQTEVYAARRDQHERKTEVASLQDAIGSLEVDRRALRGHADAERTAAILQGQGEQSRNSLPSPKQGDTALPEYPAGSEESLRRERDLLGRQLEAAEATIVALRCKQAELVEQNAKGATMEARAKAAERDLQAYRDAEEGDGAEYRSGEEAAALQAAKNRLDAERETTALQVQRAERGAQTSTMPCPPPPRCAYPPASLPLLSSLPPSLRRITQRGLWNSRRDSTPRSKTQATPLRRERWGGGASRD